MIRMQVEGENVVGISIKKERRGGELLSRENGGFLVTRGNHPENPQEFSTSS